MKKLQNLIPILILISPVLAIITPSGSLTNAKLCADTTLEGGNDCVQNFGDCAHLDPAGSYSNFLQDVNEGTVKWAGNRGSVGDFIRVYNEAYGTSAPLNCYSKDSIKYLVSIPTFRGSKGADELGSLAFEQIFSDFRPRACNPGTQPSVSKNYNITGCCPVNYDLVTVKSETTSYNSALVGAACCLNTGSLIPDYFDPSGSTDYLKCKDSSGNSVWNAPTDGSGKQTVIVTNADLNTFTIGPSTGRFTAVQKTGSDFICPKNSQCAVTDSANMTVIDPAKLENTQGLNCVKCYTTGDPIGTSTPPNIAPTTANVDKSIGFVRYCTGAGGQIKDETLIGTVDITKGYLLEDSTNQAIYKQCFETGGIYTAIGCIDPTPTGIITGVIRIALGVMGGVALLQLIYVGILYQQGNTEKIKGARTQLIATLTGVAVLVFSVLILRVIGVNILDTVANGSV